MAAILAEQLALDLQDLADDVTPAPASDDAPSSPTTGSRGSRPKPKRNIGALPKSLPRCEQIIEPESTICPCCAGKLHRIGEDVSDALDVEPAILRVLRAIRPKYACRACEEVVVQAKAPARLVEGGMVTTALVVHIAVAKYGWRSTLYRQMQILAGHGVELDAGEMDEAGRMDAQSPLSSSTHSHARLPASVLL
jgi:transposase